MMNSIHLSEPVIVPSEQLKSAEGYDKKRVAIYVRVGQSCDDSVSSSELFKRYYADYVKSRPDWKLVDIYIDEGTSNQHFLNLIEDCKAGKVDYILTKSISWLARANVDVLTIIKELKNHNPPIGVLFESIHMDTLNKDDYLSLLLVLAQIESQKRAKAECGIGSLREAIGERATRR